MIRIKLGLTALAVSTCFGTHCTTPQLGTYSGGDPELSVSSADRSINQVHIGQYQTRRSELSPGNSALAIRPKICSNGLTFLGAYCQC